jgi:hypothetical protein
MNKPGQSGRSKGRSKSPLKPEDFGRLRELSQDEFEQQLKLPPFRLSQETKADLNQIIAAMNGLMDEERSVPPRSGDSTRIKKMHAKISGMVDELDRLGRDGRRAIRSVAEPIADMLSIDWFRWRFPNDEWPSRYGRTVLREPVRQPIRQQIRGRSAEQTETDRKHWFVQGRTADTLLAVLHEIEARLGSALAALNAAPGAYGGRERLVYRHIFLINLAEFWHSIGQKVSGGPDSTFTSFCEHVVDSVGWPTKGVKDAVPKATKDWRETKRRFPKISLAALEKSTRLSKSRLALSSPSCRDEY